jgi:hypothetical protein
MAYHHLYIKMVQGWRMFADNWSMVAYMKVLVTTEYRSG